MVNTTSDALLRLWNLRQLGCHNTKQYVDLRNNIVHQNIGLAHSIAAKMWQTGVLKPLGTLHDANQEACMALAKCTESFNPVRPDANWPAYVSVGVARHLKSEARGAGIITTARNIWRKKNQLSNPKNFKAAKLAKQIVSLSDELSTRMSYVHDFESVIQSAEVRDAIASLPARLQQVLQLRVFEQKTLAEAGKAIGLTKERVRQLELKALCKIREKVVA